jgi:DNA repair protein RadC
METRREVIESKFEFVREVSVHYHGPRRTKIKIDGPQAAAKFIRQILPDNSREHFITLYLDGAHQVAAFSRTATGTANSCPVHPREIFQPAILVGALAIVIGHNHPSGDSAPSAEDREITRRLKESASLLGIKLLDHVIVADDSAYFFSEDPTSELLFKR